MDANTIKKLLKKKKEKRRKEEALAGENIHDD